MKCDRRVGYALQENCDGELVMLAVGKVTAFMCLTCSLPSLRCTECGEHMRRMFRADALKCVCGHEVVLKDDNPKQLGLFP